MDTPRVAAHRSDSPLPPDVPLPEPEDLSWFYSPEARIFAQGALSMLMAIAIVGVILWKLGVFHL